MSNQTNRNQGVQAPAGTPGLAAYEAQLDETWSRLAEWRRYANSYLLHVELHGGDVDKERDKLESWRRDLDKLQRSAVRQQRAVDDYRALIELVQRRQYPDEVA